MLRASHILIAHEDATRSQRNVSREEALFLIADIQKKMLNNELTFEQAAKMYSDCPSGKANGGDLGFIKREQMDKLFVVYLEGLRPGETSGICCTPFGFHIIRRNQDVNLVQSPQISKTSCTALCLSTSFLANETISINLLARLFNFSMKSDNPLSLGLSV